MKAIKIFIIGLFINCGLFGQVVIECNLQPDQIDTMRKLGILSYEEIKQLVANNANNNQSVSVFNTYAYYIDYRTLKFVAKALRELEDNSGNLLYNGVNFHFVTPLKKHLATDPNFQTKISITPALSSNSKLLMYYGVFRNFYNSLSNGERSYFEENKINSGIACNGVCDSAVANWTIQGNSKRLIKLPYQEKDVTNPVLFPEKDVLKDNIRRNNSKHNNEHCAGCQTKSVFFAKWKIDLIDNFLTSKKEAEFPIFALYFICNNIKDPNLRQKDARQTSIVIVPMAWQNGHHVPDPCSFIKYCIENTNAISAFNEERIKDIDHGELCPERCPDEGN